MLGWVPYVNEYVWGVDHKCLVGLAVALAAGSPISLTMY